MGGNKILDYIKNNIGFENTLIFLTADHGVASEPNELLKNNQ